MPAARNQDVTVRRREAKRMPSRSRGTRAAVRGSSQWAMWPKALATEVGRCDNAMAGSLVRWVVITPSSPRGRPSSTPLRSAGILLAEKKRSNVGHGRRISRSFAQSAVVKKPGPVAAPKRDACRQDVLELRRQGRSLAEIKEHLGDQHSISESSIYRI